MELEDDVLALQLDEEAFEEKKPPPPPPATRDQRRGTNVDFSISNAFRGNDFQIDSDNIVAQRVPKGKVDLWIDDDLDEDVIVNEGQHEMNEQIESRESVFDAEGIPIIPDLDDLRLEDLMQQTAAAPAVSTFIDYTQFEEAILKHSAFAAFNGIELSVLIKRLVVTNYLEEEDVPWKWTNLISDVSSTLQTMDEKF